MSGWLTWVVRLMTPSMTAAISATPHDSPSSPSIKLMLLIIPTIQKIGEPDRERRLNRITPSPNGLLTMTMPIPSATADHRQEAHLAAQLPAGAEVEQVVHGTDDRGRRSPERTAR